MLKLYVVALLCTVNHGTSHSCQHNRFPCRTTNQCINLDRYCNGFPDCDDNSDELPDCTPCNLTYYGDVGRTYELEVKLPPENQVPFLCFLNFTAGGGGSGDIVQLSFESFAVGKFESFTQDGCPDGHVSITEGGRVDTGGKWCGSAWGYSVYYSETANVNLTLFLKTVPQQLGSNFEFKLSYKFLKTSEAKIRYGNATQKLYRGRLDPETYCDRILEGCSQRPCRIQSPNFPGIYPRNLSCHYLIRERHVPKGKHALIAIRQTNFNYKEQTTKFESTEKVFSIWDQCNVMQDFIELRDGSDMKAPVLAHLCSGETVPEIVSSGPELLVNFQTSTFGNPFHPLPLSYLPGFELEVQVFFVNKESSSYVEHGKKCEFILTTFDNSSGLLESPRHSLPPNTTCHYHFRGQLREVVWISFIKYHVANDRLVDYDAGDCDVQLQLWDGDIKTEKTAPLIGEFCKDDKPKLCDHSLLSNSTRVTRPCATSESYVSSGPDLTVTHSTRYGNVLYPVSFMLRYEFVDFAQEGSQVSNPCDRIFRDAGGKFYSPKITFLYGRGGKENLNCTYHFENNDSYGLKITFLKTNFGGKKNCYSKFHPESGRWICYILGASVAYIRIAEYPWPGIELYRDCICNNLSRALTVTTRTARKVIVSFIVTKMNITEDYNDYYFDATYEFVHAEKSCLNPWKTRRLRGSSGEITVRNVRRRLEQLNETMPYCVHQPWLIEPENSFSNFLYVKIKGLEVKNGTECGTKNRIFVYPAARGAITIICPQDGAEVELFSEGWKPFSYELYRKNARSFIVEFLQREPGSFALNWIEISKNPALTMPTSQLMINPPNCLHSCPELGACISSELWCDGLRHCPSGNDEQEVNCSADRDFPIGMVTSTTVFAVILVGLLLGIFFCCWRHRKRGQKNSIVTVTEHTFLEFKNGLC